MGKVAIGLFRDVNAAEILVKELEAQGFSPAEVEMVADRRDFETGPPLGPLEQSRSESALGAGSATARESWHAALIRALTALGVPEGEAEDYAEGVRRGSALVVVKTGDERADRAAEEMNRRDALRVEELAAEWEAAGWQRQFPRGGRERGLSPGLTHAEGVQAGRIRYGAGGARVFIW